MGNSVSVAIIRRFVGAFFVIASAAHGFNALAGEPQASFATTGAQTNVPYEWVDFCGRRPEACHVPRLPPVDVSLSAQSWRLLDQVNRQVNASIQPVSNLEHWGTLLDHWDYPVDGKGDCKIYALYKRKLLLDVGFPRQALLMTIVYDLQGDGHTILTVKTDRGEFILDNLSNDSGRGMHPATAS